jgi:hypothetical protein
VDTFSDEINEITKVFALSRDEWTNRELPVCLSAAGTKKEEEPL